MPKLIDLTGQKFGRLTVIERAENKGKHTYWKCRCDCGNDCVINSSNLIHGLTKSCGCLWQESVSSHGIAKLDYKIYKTWFGIKERCTNPKHISYNNYGARKILIYPDWLNNPKNFYDYVSKLEHFGEEGYTLDRINNNGNYEPNNLRWADTKTQCRNKSNNHLVEYEGKIMTFIEMVEKSGINESTLRGRIRRGDTGEKLFRPVKHKVKKSNGKSYD